MPLIRFTFEMSLDYQLMIKQVKRSILISKCFYYKMWNLVNTSALDNSAVVTAAKCLKYCSVSYFIINVSALIAQMELICVIFLI